MATHSSILAWRIPWTEELGWLHPWDCKQLDTTEQLTLWLWLLYYKFCIFVKLIAGVWTQFESWKTLLYPPIQFKSVEDHFFIHQTSFKKIKRYYIPVPCACVLSCFSHVWLCTTLWTVACQPLSMLFSRQEYWSGLSCSSLGDLPNLGIKPASPGLAGFFFFLTTSTIWEVPIMCPSLC